MHTYSCTYSIYNYVQYVTGLTRPLPSKMDKESVHRDTCCHEVVVRVALNVQLFCSNLEKKGNVFPVLNKNEQQHQKYLQTQ